MTACVIRMSVKHHPRPAPLICAMESLVGCNRSLFPKSHILLVLPGNVIIKVEKRGKAWHFNKTCLIQVSVGQLKTLWKINKLSFKITTLKEKLRGLAKCKHEEIGLN